LGSERHRAAPEPDTIGFKPSENGLAHVFGTRGVLELGCSGNRRSRPTRSLHSQVFRKASSAIIDARLISFMMLVAHTDAPVSLLLCIARIVGVTKRPLMPGVAGQPFKAWL
jgi:hypothetical protein